MGVRWTNVVVVMVVVAALKVHCILEESLQSLETLGREQAVIDKEEVVLPGLNDHAESKSLAPREEKMTEAPTSELPEPLPTPVALEQKKPEAEVSGTAKKLPVPRKRVSSFNSSVVAKKEVYFIPSVVAKKGADPQSSSPSVSPRKGAEPYQTDLVHSQTGQMHSMLEVATTENTNGSPLPSNINVGNVTTRVNETKNQARQEASDNIPVPQLIQKVKANESLLSVTGNISQPSSESVSTFSSAVVTSKSKSKSNIDHFKPATADDAGAAKSQVNYAPIFMIVALVVLVGVVVAVAYHRLKDIWIRRHYDYVDFLIDGMYE